MFFIVFQLREKLKSFGIDIIEDLTLVEDPKNEGMNRGFAFMEFSARSDATMVISFKS
jgi:RNA recognition motif-containing protein